jgi:hypothetical protein
VELPASSAEACPDKCQSCVDHMSGLALPSVVLSASTTGSLNPHDESEEDSGHSHSLLGGGISTLDHFYAMASRLPPPPPTLPGNRPGVLDATNLGVYHKTGAKSRNSASGLVQLPPLNCCAGRCKCAGGRCGCGSDCGGSCGDHFGKPGIGKGQNSPLRTEANSETENPRRSPKASKGCCKKQLTTWSLI